MADLVVDVAVCEHCVEVLDTLLGVPVVVVLQAFLYRAHVHRSLDDLIVVLEGDREQREGIGLHAFQSKTHMETKLGFCQLTTKATVAHVKGNTS